MEISVQSVEVCLGVYGRCLYGFCMVYVTFSSTSSNATLNQTAVPSFSSTITYSANYLRGVDMLPYQDPSFMFDVSLLLYSSLSISMRMSSSVET